MAVKDKVLAIIAEQAVMDVGDVTMESTLLSGMARRASMQSPRWRTQRGAISGSPTRRAILGADTTNSAPSPCAYRAQSDRCARPAD